MLLLTARINPRPTRISGPMRRGERVLAFTDVTPFRGVGLPVHDEARLGDGYFGFLQEDLFVHRLIRPLWMCAGYRELSRKGQMGQGEWPTEYRAIAEH